MHDSSNIQEVAPPVKPTWLAHVDERYVPMTLAGKINNSGIIPGLAESELESRSNESLDTNNTLGCLLHEQANRVLQEHEVVALEYPAM